MQKIVVTGAGGFIAGHLVKELLKKGHKVRAVDIKPLNEWYQLSPEADNLVLDLRLRENCYKAVNGYNEVFNLAADMGGMGFIENNKAACMISVLINTHLLIASRDCGISRFFYASSACVYNGEKQTDPNNPGLKESDAYPALAEDGYGWEKLFSERMCRHFMEDFGLTARVARFHNVYGPFGTYDGGREKAPAAICRKVIESTITGNKEIVIWGDGHQTRSFMYIDDCIKGILDIMYSDIIEPINLGSSEMVSINELVDIVEEIAGVKLVRKYDPDAPKGVRGRNSENTLIKKYLGWEPSIPLRTGMKKTYDWIKDQMLHSTESKKSKSRFNK
ncbi:MAG TPA: NAD-dependent epimerase/dehydratase family protein [Bacteroidales bacterium]|jgi:nucleoside-diphosphate-sugar epimerase|nr:NAD-dependent epimerase/dehydratase family protein [Bacteroidales bacterium]OQB60404.1 MAG: dTDP-4-oxo-6-deoxy-D-allose reductase [Bacteroidetes bacterium ADurb.Bin145]NMD02355.1 NAD-dependent epimerase/dehydratase family protein [Bacteroidales bacterium]HOU03518.1 NAD-dependent epimerase/dehydratase family protein [Bacteroidales bacterium]HQG63242.1 NAD-dependent epimerase/dehydratase family protein [Bacteroidales bacterium]